MNTLSIPTGTGFYTYVHRDGDGIALYVGSTTHPLGRTANHVANKKRSHWFVGVVSIEWVSHPTNELMLAYESGLIAHLDTPHNKQGVKLRPPVPLAIPNPPQSAPPHVDNQIIRSVQGRTIRDARDAKGITAIDLAATLKVTRAAVSAWERGVATPIDVHQLAIADALDVPVSFIFGEVAA